MSFHHHLINNSRTSNYSTTQTSNVETSQTLAVRRTASLCDFCVAISWIKSSDFGNRKLIPLDTTTTTAHSVIVGKQTRNSHFLCSRCRPPLSAQVFLPGEFYSTSTSSSASALLWTSIRRADFSPVRSAAASFVSCPEVGRSAGWLAGEQKAIIICWPSNNTFPYWIWPHPPPFSDFFFSALHSTFSALMLLPSSSICSQITGNGAPFSI